MSTGDRDWRAFQYVKTDSLVKLRTLFLGSAAPRHTKNLSSRERANLEPYAQYCSGMIERGGDAAAVQGEFNACRRFLEQQDDAGQPIFFLRRLYDEHPPLAVWALHLRNEVRRPTPRLERNYQEWFDAALEEAAGTSDCIREFFTAWEGTAQHTAPVTRSFLHDFQAEMHGMVAAAMNMACCFAAHAQREDCAVYTISTPFRINGDPAGVQAAMMPILNSKLYRTHSGHLFPDGITGKQVRIPTYVSFVDTVEYLRFLRLFWGTLPGALMQQQRNGGGSNGVCLEVIGRDHPTEDAQARFSLGLLGGIFDKFSVRVDQEDVNGGTRLSLDVGGVNRDAALKYARELATQAEQGELVMKYSETVGASGSMKDVWDPSAQFPKGLQRPHVALMHSAALKPAERAALFAAASFEAGKGIVIPPDASSFSYHYRGRLAKPAYNAAFPTIVRDLRSSLRNARMGGK